MSNVLTVADVIVKQDDQGRYCLNDLHKAAGEVKHQQPAKFFANQQAKDLISEIGDFAVSVKMGRNGGTFACKELVYAYAMWISPAFHLKVIRAYDELQTQGVAFSDKAVEQVASGELDEDALVLKAVDILQRKVARLQSERDGVVKTIGQYNHSINRVARTFEGVNTNATKRDLLELGYLYKRAGAYRVYSKFFKFFEERFDETSGFVNIYVTAEGKALLGRLYEEGKLTMKVGYRK